MGKVNAKSSSKEAKKSKVSGGKPKSKVVAKKVLKPSKPVQVEKSAKKSAPKPVKKTAPQQNVKKAAKAEPLKTKPAKKAASQQQKQAQKQKMCKNNPSKPCCGKKNCDCASNSAALISEIFGCLSSTKALEELLKDYFFTELLKRGFDENCANDMANKVSIQIGNFDADIDIE